jgi:hypothetical protein
MFLGIGGADYCISWVETLAALPSDLRKDGSSVLSARGKDTCLSFRGGAE